MTVKPAMFTFVDGDIASMYLANPDGIGVAWFDGEQRHVARHLPTCTVDAVEFIRSLNIHDHESILHFRWATHGKPTMANCHPFGVTHDADALMVFHNGVLNETTLMLNVGTGTDTAAFIRQYIAPTLRERVETAHHWTLNDPDTALVKRIGSLIGGSKILTMDCFGRITTINADYGTDMCFEDALTGMIEEFWISNSNWVWHEREDFGYESPQFPIYEVNYEFYQCV